MVLPFKIPHAGLQAFRKRFFYWRVVYNYRMAMQHDFMNRKPLRKFSRFFLGVMAIKALQKGARARKEENLHDYNARKDNITATEEAMWDDELSLHSVNVAAAEESVHRQRVLEWECREKPQVLNAILASYKVPFHVNLQ